MKLTRDCLKVWFFASSKINTVTLHANSGISTFSRTKTRKSHLIVQLTFGDEEKKPHCYGYSEYYFQFCIQKFQPERILHSNNN